MSYLFLYFSVVVFFLCYCCCLFFFLLNFLFFHLKTCFRLFNIGQWVKADRQEYPLCGTGPEEFLPIIHVQIAGVLDRVQLVVEVIGPTGRKRVQLNM